MARGRARRYYGKAKYYGRVGKRRFKSRYKKTKKGITNMSKPQKKALAWGVLGTVAVLVFQPGIYRMIAEKMGRA